MHSVREAFRHADAPSQLAAILLRQHEGLPADCDVTVERLVRKLEGGAHLKGEAAYRILRYRLPSLHEHKPLRGLLLKSPLLLLLHGLMQRLEPRRLADVRCKK